MIQRSALLATLVLPFAALAACSGGAGNNSSAAANETVPTAAAENGSAAAGGSSSGVAMQPGEWEMTMTAEGAPAMPPQRICVTQAMADQSAADMVSGGATTTPNGMNCDRSGISVVGGRITGSATCTGPQGNTTIAMDGQINPTDYNIRQQITIAGRTMSTNITARRTGECTASTPRVPDAPGAAPAGNAAEPAE